MTTQLQQALLDDNLQVVQRKIQLGSYPHAVYAKALMEKAWTCAQWLASTFPYTLTHWDWHELSRNAHIAIDADVVRLAHIQGIDKVPSQGWKNSVNAWEKKGVQFPLFFYQKLWQTSGAAFKTRQLVVDLGILHRFEPIEAWFNTECAPAEKEIRDVFKQLWDHALLHCDNTILLWLASRSSRATQMEYLYNAVTVRALPLARVLARRANNLRWDMDKFLSHSLPALFDDVDDFCQYVALYDTPRLRHMWSKMEHSTLISPQWRIFLASGATGVQHACEGQRLVMVLRGLFPEDEKMRMQHNFEARNAIALPKTDLVDLL